MTKSPIFIIDKFSWKYVILEGLAYIPFANGRIEDFIADLGRVGTQ